MTKKVTKKKVAPKPSKVATRVSKALKEKRSEAAFKGWKTRQRKAREAERLAAIRKQKRIEAAAKAVETRRRKAREAERLARKRSLAVKRGWETRRANERIAIKSAKKRVEKIASSPNKDLERRLKAALNKTDEVVALKKKLALAEKKIALAEKRLKKALKSTEVALKKKSKRVVRQTREKAELAKLQIGLKKKRIIHYASKYFVMYDSLTKEQLEKIFENVKTNTREAYKLGLYAVKIGYDAAARLIKI